MKSTLSFTSEVICTRQPYFHSLFVSRFFAFSKRVAEPSPRWASKLLLSRGNVIEVFGHYAKSAFARPQGRKFLKSSRFYPEARFPIAAGRNGLELLVKALLS